MLIACVFFCSIIYSQNINISDEYLVVGGVSADWGNDYPHIMLSADENPMIIYGNNSDSYLYISKFSINPFIIQTTNICFIYYIHVYSLGNILNRIQI